MSADFDDIVSDGGEMTSTGYDSDGLFKKAVMLCAEMLHGPIYTTINHQLQKRAKRDCSSRRFQPPEYGYFCSRI